MNEGIQVGQATEKTFRLIIAVILLVVAGRTFNANAQTETNLHSFGSVPSDGDDPDFGLVQGNDGNFYGTTSQGGTYNTGTVFRISPGGSYSNLYSFGSRPNDGEDPQGELVQGNDGNFYGTTNAGGRSTNCVGGCGTVFRISPSGTYTTLYSFGSSPADGDFPQFKLVQGRDGNFYGAASGGGTSTNCDAGCGTVFRISPSGSETNLYSFGRYPNDGTIPNGLVQGSDGNFYGTTYQGGTYDYGTVFRISPGGSYSNLYSFGSGPNDGDNPNAGLMQGSDGNFYGTTVQGGTNDVADGGDGTVFRIGPSGTYTTLYSFGSSPGDGDYPFAELVQGSDGNLYGTASTGGTTSNCDCGTVFRISPGGSYSNLYSFGGSYTDGETPEARLVQGSDGNFYGTTTGGGTNGAGTVFKFSVPLSPPPYPINQITGLNLAGTNIIFTIPSIAGETYQLQYRNSMTSGSWSNVPGVSVTNSIGSILTLTNFAGASQPQGFYRFAITP